MRLKVFLFVCSCVFLLFASCCFASIDLAINEISWAGNFNSSSDEWIELYNFGSESVNIDGWILASIDGSPNIELAGLIEANSFYLLERSDDDSVLEIEADIIYSGSLSNAGECLELWDSEDNLIDSIDCSDGWLAGDNDNKLSMQKVDGVWIDSCTDAGTPGAQNISCPITDNNNEVSQSDPATNEENDEEQSNNQDLSDSNNSQETIVPNQTDIKNPIYNYAGDIIISEIMPNPMGVDTDEWIELYNKGNSRINLSGWILSDDKSEYKIGDVYLSGNEYLLFGRNKTNIALNNTKDEIKLYSPKETGAAIIVKFSEAPEGASLVHNFEDDNEEWLWTVVVTPGKENIIEIPNREPFIDFELPNFAEVGEYIVCDASDSIDPDGDSLEYAWKIGESFRASGILISHLFYIPGKYEIELEISDGKHVVNLKKKINISGEELKVDNFKDGDAVIRIKELATVPEEIMDTDEGYVISKASKEKTSPTIYSIPNTKIPINNKEIISGIVTTLPGVLASQYFYITNEDKSYQVYSYKKDFKEISLGDKIEVVGERSLINDEVRIKTGNSGDINIVGHNNIAEIVPLESNALNNELLGSLVKIKGEVVKKDGLNIYIDDGLGELKIYLKESVGIKSSFFSVGEKIELVGIFSKTNLGFRILPRSTEDVKILGIDDKGVVLGEISTNSSWILDKRATSNNWIKYSLVILFSIISVLLVVFFKNKKH